VQGYLLGRPLPILDYSNLVGRDDAAGAKLLSA
jgi:hypothetical protein